MVKIKVSYETQQELEWVLKKLKPDLLSYKVAKSNTGRFKKAYFDLKKPNKT